MRIIRLKAVYLAVAFLSAVCGWKVEALDNIELERTNAVSSNAVSASVSDKTNVESSVTTNQESIRLRTMERNIVEIGSDAVIRDNEVAPDAVIVFGSVRIDGRVDRNLVVIGGNAVINGKVGGDVIVIMGYADFGPKSEVDGKTTVIGGHIKTASGAKLRHAPFNLSLGLGWLSFGWFKDWLFKGLLYARPLVPELRWMWSFTIVVFVFYTLITLVLPKPVQACVAILETKPLMASLMGLLFFVFLSPFSLLLIASVAGLLALPFIFCGMIAGILIGKVALYQYVGKQIGGQMGLALLARPLTALTTGMAVFCLFYSIPILGFIVWGLALPMGLGCVLLALIAAFRKETAPKNPPPPIYVNPPNESTSDIHPAPTQDMIFLPRAGFWIRFFATLIDLILVGVLMAFVHTIWPFLWAAYHFIMWAWKGTTIGGIVFGLKVVRMDGKPVDFSVSLVRCLAAFLSAVPLFLGFFWAGWDKERQSWHDKIAGTVIVKTPKGTTLI